MSSSPLVPPQNGFGLARLLGVIGLAGLLLPLLLAWPLVQAQNQPSDPAPQAAAAPPLERPALRAQDVVSPPELISREVKLIPGPTDNADFAFLGFAAAIEQNRLVIGAPLQQGSGAAYVFESPPSGAVWGQRARLLGLDTTDGDNLGYAVALSGDTIAVSAPFADAACPGDGACNSGAVYIFERNRGGPNNWGQTAKLTPSDAQAGAHFGWSLAMLSDTLVIGAPALSSSTGAVYIFERGGGWVDGQANQQARLTALDADAGDQFGQAVALSLAPGGGQFSLLIGAPGDDAGADNGGAAYIFRAGAGWVDGGANQHVKLIPSSPAPDDQFGYAVALQDGGAVIGAPFNDDAGANAGTAYVFAQGGGWSNGAANQLAQLAATNGAGGDRFGHVVAIQSELAVVGAFRAAPGQQTEAGAVYIFGSGSGGWSQKQRVTAADASAGDQFGFALAISEQGLVVGAPADDDGCPNLSPDCDSGSAYLFEATGSSLSQLAKLRLSDLAPGDRFGTGVALNGDLAAGGSPRNDDAGESSGSAYIFARTETGWGPQLKLTAPDAAAGDQFGAALALDDKTLLIGAPLHSHSGQSEAGAAYVFVLSGSTWLTQAKLVAADPEAGAQFGAAVALHGDTALIGAPHQDERSPELGAAYIFQRSGLTWTQQAKLSPSTGGAGTHFGAAVALGPTTALIGAPGGLKEQGKAVGAAYVFTRTPPASPTLLGAPVSWGQSGLLSASGLISGAEFGTAVALEEDGGLAVVGAPLASGAGPEAGAAYLFQETAGGWSQLALLSGQTTSAGDQFGRSVGLSGGVVVIGAPGDDPGGEAQAGSLAVFASLTPAGTGPWLELGQIVANDGAGGEAMGQTLTFPGKAG